MGYKGNGYVVICTLEPKPFPSVRLNNQFTRIDYTAKCTLKDVLEGMAGILKVSIDDLTLETEDGKGVILDQSLLDFYDQHTEPRSSCIDGRWHRWPRYVKTRRKEINLKVRHTASPNRLVTCIVGGGEGRDALRRTTVLLSNMATFGELLIRARSQRYGAIQREGPVYGQPGELETTLRDAWVRDGCEVDGTLHIGLVVVVSVCGWFGMPLSLVMRPSDIISDVKRRISSDQGIPESQQILSFQAGPQRLNDDVSLIGCCNVGGEVNQLSGWSELHLELNVKNSSFSPTNPLTVAVGRAKDANRYPPVASHKCYSKSEGAQTSPITPLSHWWGRRSSPPPPQSAFPPPSPGALSPGTIVQIGNAFVNDIVKRRPKTFRGNAPWPVEFFALSPSGRAFTLSVPQDGSVLDAKEQVEIHEGVPPYHQRLLWRGIPLEPDHASLHELGVRGRDTLILGYRIPRFPPDSSTPVIQLGNSQIFVPESQAGPGCKFSTRVETSSSIYFAGNTTPGEDERRVGMSHRGGYPRGFRAMDDRVDSESGGIWGSSSRQSNGSWPANAKFQNYRRNAGRGVGRNGALPRGGGYANVDSRQPSTSGRGNGQNFSGWVPWKHSRRSPAPPTSLGRGRGGGRGRGRG